MTAYSTTADTGIFVWYHSWLLKDGIWDDDGRWVDAATWAPLEGINFGISETAGSGVFALAGQDAFKSIGERIDFGAFVLSFEDAVSVRKDRTERKNSPNRVIVSAVTQSPNRVIVSAVTPNEAA